jgi:hypothetical protein
VASEQDSDRLSSAAKYGFGTNMCEAGDMPVERSQSQERVSQVT